MIYNLFGDVTPKTFSDIKQMVEQNPTDNELLINIDTYGGNLDTAFALADYLRSIPALNVKTHIQGNCMSAGTIIALIAPKENRSATRHSVFMCHSPLIDTSGMQDTETINCLANTMNSALNELVEFYQERTGMDNECVKSLVGSKREFFAKEALQMGFISQIDTLYNKNENKKLFNSKKIINNKHNSMKKSLLKALCNKIIARMLNEVYTTKDGAEIEIVAYEIGGVANAEDGVYEMSNGDIVTIESGVITDIQSAEQPTEQPTELENEGETELPKEEEEKAVEEVKEEVEQVATDVADAENVEDLTEIAKEIQQVVEEKIEEVVAKYKPMAELVNACGGMSKLKTLANVKHDTKKFVDNSAKSNSKRSIADLMALKRK